ncbi:Uncharacterised protein [Vibrio cholerae]|nr:Uncharacterised protein [Vibrio cholerae]
MSQKCADVVDRIVYGIAIIEIFFTGKSTFVQAWIRR